MPAGGSAGPASAGAAPTHRIAALDGLRTVAMVSVVAYHSHVPGASSGWLGVDVFFVLSGFLITGLLLAELESERGRIGLRAFYVRRAARLYPAMLVLVAAFLAMKAVGLSETPAYAALLVVGYVMDFARMNGSDYGTLGHTWSLGIEEQFYLLWPLIMIGLRFRRRIAIGALALGLASLAVAVATSGAAGEWSPRAFNGPDTRFWELLVGCLLAVVVRSRPPTPRVGTAGAALAVVSLVAVLPFAWAPGQWIAQSVVAVLGTVGALVAVTTRASATRVLAWRPMVFVGRISYGGYLFHNPIVVVAALVLPVPPVVRFVIALAATLLAAWISFRFIEEPIRRYVVARWGRPEAGTPRRDAGPADAAAVETGAQAPTVDVQAGPVPR